MHAGLKGDDWGLLKNMCSVSPHSSYLVIPQTFSVGGSVLASPFLRLKMFGELCAA